MGIKLESVSVYIFYLILFFLPLFVLPLSILPISLSKALLLYFGIIAVFLLWLFMRLQKGNLIVPKSGLLLSLLAIVAMWFVSSLFSLNTKMSLTGSGYDMGTFAFFLFLGVGSFLVSILFSSEQRAAIFYFILFASSVFVFLIQLLHTVFGINIVPGGVLSGSVSNLVGGWNDLAVFFGFIALSAISFFELFKFGKKLKLIFLFVALLSLLAMASVNFSTAWYIFGFSSLILFVYLLSREFYGKKEKIFAGHRTFFRLSLLVLIIAVLFILGRGILGNLTSFLGTDIVEVRPSWGTTYGVVKDTLKEKLILGSGPNTFLYDWLRFKPASVNSTAFWGARFQSGIGHVPSMFAEAGILGALALISFFGFLLYYGARVASYTKNDFSRVLLISSFLGSFYLWAFVIFYTPGFVVFSLAFIVTGLFIAVLAKIGAIKTLEISFLKNSKVGFVSVLVIVLLMISSVSAVYMLFQKYWSAYSYFGSLSALNSSGDIDKAEELAVRAARFDRQDRYFRLLADLGILRMQQATFQAGDSPEGVAGQFQNALGAAVQNAQIAVNLNRIDPLNWQQLGRVYESAASFGVAGAREFAIGSYKEALNTSPLDPTFFVDMARTEVQSGSIEQARDYIQSSLVVKNDFAPALFLLSQIEVNEGNLKQAIVRAEQSVIIMPNDIGALFHLGLLYYQDRNYSGARAALERAILLNPFYANAMYFLGLSYEKLGMVSEAIGQFERIEELNPDNAEVKAILKNLRSGSGALSGISPPAKAPEERGEPPISEE